MVARKYLVQLLAWLLIALPSAFASGYYSAGVNLANVVGALAIANGGTANIYGGGLFSDGTIHTITGNETLTSTSQSLNITSGALSGTTTITLPQSNTCPGKIFYFHSIDAQTLTLSRAGSDVCVKFGQPTATNFSLNSNANAVIGIMSMGAANKWVQVTPNMLFTSASSTGALLYSNGNGIQGITAVAAGQVPMSAGTNTVPAYTGSPSFSGSVTAGTTVTATSGAITATSGNFVATNGNLRLETSGNHIAIETGGAAPMMGTVTLSGGTADFNTTAVATGDQVWLQRVSGTSAEFGKLTYTISNGSKVVVNSTDAQDDSVVNVLIVRPL